ncbi:DNA primase [Candidatus Pantoea edessiphila]|uniref:DNA primase n=1 Tax=Candidatus Pantoea edessiphila TaxID=2044610 RepID=A0A2P5SXR6_9GAMM|nr:DNA primase [Candidatus Pantoea edessiphila]MBK4775742.1 DNA primase [Pantoea sp. Edef]PPI87138.1 DNA primase [Candidatus Pantoea edessiphila]
MTERISRKFIINLLDNTDIINLISTRISLKKQGNNFYAHCPFHKETNPSFTVNSEKQFYYCFGCGIHGNAIDFLMKYENLNFITAIEELANINNVEIIFENSQFAHKKNIFFRKKLYVLIDNIYKFYKFELNKVSSKYALNYLNNRGLNSKTIERFGIGFAPVGWKNILNQFGKTHEDRELLIKAGMLTSNENGVLYDRFRERIIFPIRNKTGQTVGFGGRALTEQFPKYLNSPETDLFHKRNQLYGLYETLNYNPKPNFLIIVEGYIDVITLSQYNINYVVGLLGTAITSEHIKQLFYVTTNIICCFDGDFTGRKAAWKTLKTALPYMNDGYQLGFVFLPDNEDPDALIRKEGREAFEKRIKKNIPLSSFLFDTLLTQVDLNSYDSRTKLSALALPLISQVPGKTLRIYMRQLLGIKLGILDDYCIEQLIPKIKNKQTTPVIPSFKFTTMRILLALLIQNPKLAILVPSFSDFSDHKIVGLSIFIELVNQCNKNYISNTAQLLELYRGTNFINKLETLALWNHMIVDEQIKVVFQDSLSKIRDNLREQQLESLITRDRIKKLNSEERNQFWILSKTFAKK